MYAPDAGYNDQRGRGPGEMTEEVIPVTPDAFGTFEQKALATSSPRFLDLNDNAFGTDCPAFQPRQRPDNGTLT